MCHLLSKKCRNAILEEITFLAVLSQKKQWGSNRTVKVMHGYLEIGGYNLQTRKATFDLAGTVCAFGDKMPNMRTRGDCRRERVKSRHLDDV